MKHLKKIVTIIGILCLTNTFFAQAGLSENDAGDFFEFVVVEETEAFDASEEDIEDDSSDVVPMVSGRAVTAESAPVAEPAESTAADTAESATSAENEPAATAAATEEATSVAEMAAVPAATTTADDTGAVTAQATSTATSSANANPETTASSSASSASTQRAFATSTAPAAQTGTATTSGASSAGASSATGASAAASSAGASSATGTSATASSAVAESNATAETESILYEPEAEDEEIEETPVDEKAPSRSVTIKKRQYLDVTYPGEGWLFMGDEYNSKALSFKGREQKGNSTLMKFYSDRAGEALLHFCKQDILTDTYIHDYLLVTVDKTTGNRQHIEAPEYIPAPALNKDTDIADIGEEQLEEQVEEADISEVAEVSEPEENEGEEIDSEIDFGGGISLADEPDVVFSFGDGIDFSDYGDDDYYQQLIDEANDAFFAGRGQEAVDKAQIVIDDGSYFSDEALYIQAQVYETDTALLDVNKAYGLYKIIVDYYPESSLWSKASKRVTYLERYYYAIR